MHVLVAVGGADSVPELRRTSSGDLVVEAPYQGQTVYHVQFNRGTAMPVEDRLQRLIDVETFEIVEEDLGSATATIRLTATGASRRMRPDSWHHIGVTSISPTPPESGPECIGLTVSFEPSDSSVDRPEPCPQSTIARELVIEGVSAHGTRLWLVAADDPRTVRSVTGPNGEPHVSARDDSQELFATVAVPTVTDLRTLRWFEVLDTNELRFIGESLWAPATWGCEALPEIVQQTLTRRARCRRGQGNNDAVCADLSPPALLEPFLATVRCL